MFLQRGLNLAIFLAAVSANEIFQLQPTKGNANVRTEETRRGMELVNVLKTRGMIFGGNGMNFQSGNMQSGSGTFNSCNMHFGGNGVTFGPNNSKSMIINFDDYSIEVRGKNVGSINAHNGVLTYKDQKICAKPLLKEKTFRKMDDGTYWYSNCNVGKPMTAEDIDRLLELLKKDEEELEETAKQHEKNYKERRARREKEHADLVKEMEKNLREKEKEKKLYLEQKEKDWEQKLKQMEQNLAQKKKQREEREKQKEMEFKKKEKEWQG